MLMPSTLSLIRNIFADASARRLAIAIWASFFTAGSALGPIVGGALLEHFHWGAVFLVAVPILLPLLVLAPRLVPESRDPNPGPLDPISVLLSLTTMLPLVWAIKTAAHDGLCRGRSAARWSIERRLGVAVRPAPEAQRHTDDRHRAVRLRPVRVVDPGQLPVDRRAHRVHLLRLAAPAAGARAEPAGGRPGDAARRLLSMVAGIAVVPVGQVVRSARPDRSPGWCSSPRASA